MTNNHLTGYRADGGEISIGRIKEIADNPYGDEEKQNLAKRLLAAEVELQKRRTVIVKPMRPGHITVGGEKIGIYLRDDVDEFMATLTAAGIKVEAE